MPDDLKTPSKTSMGKDYIETIKRSAEVGLQKRREAGEIMTYDLDGWVVREYPGQRIVHLAPIGQFRPEDHPIKE